MGVSVFPIVIGFVLGPIIESYFRQGLIMAYGDPWQFVTRPTAAAFLALTLLLLISPYILEKALGMKKPRMS
ncbi:MAG: hypothetical protein A3I72_03430 [Candidatus Tectomicrobia bacterium RIFCSPLOWO2_02_FULL_70_19]|nr:MAG: hypothetical protein A3I72_03430 [Candidatus Tectomicrobia bacterium RIFCSPLOWO2_02_FULL_70_19]